MFLKIAVKFIVAGRFSCPPKKSAATFLKTAKKNYRKKTIVKKTLKKNLIKISETYLLKITTKRF
jgi:hypothetical protein